MRRNVSETKLSGQGGGRRDTAGLLKVLTGMPRAGCRRAQRCALLENDGDPLPIDNDHERSAPPSARGESGQLPSSHSGAEPHLGARKTMMAAAAGPNRPAPARRATTDPAHGPTALVSVCLSRQSVRACVSASRGQRRRWLARTALRMRRGVPQQTKEDDAAALLLPVGHKPAKTVTRRGRYSAQKKKNKRRGEQDARTYAPRPARERASEKRAKRRDVEGSFQRNKSQQTGEGEMKEVSIGTARHQKEGGNVQGVMEEPRLGDRREISVRSH